MTFKIKVILFALPNSKVFSKIINKITFFVAGLFDKAILLGGYAVNPVMTYEPDGIAVAFTYGKILNYNGSSAKTLLNILKEKTATELLDAVAKLAAFDQKVSK